MSSVLLGLVAALSWGVNDFLARIPSRAVGPLPTVLVVTFAGLVVLTVWLLLSGHSIRLSWPQLWLPATSGIFFTLSTLSLFAALALGPVSLVAPIAGSYPVLAMFFAVAQGARPSLLQWLAVAGVLTGVVLVSRGASDPQGADIADTAPRDDPYLWWRCRIGRSLVRGGSGNVELLCDEAAAPANRLTAPRGDR